MPAQPCFCASVLRCGRDFGFDTGPSWRAVAHVPGTRGSPALREPSIPPIRYPRVCWQKRDRPIRRCSTPRKFTGTMFSKQAALRVVSRRKTASSPGACAVHKQPSKLALPGRGREGLIIGLASQHPPPFRAGCLGGGTVYGVYGGFG
jgi:hypothetical protein